jgi:hypothetical protein
MPKITDLTALTALTTNALLLVVDDPTGTPTAKKITVADTKTGLGIVPFDIDTDTPRNGVTRIRHGFNNFLSNSIFGSWLAGTSVAPDNWTLQGDATVSRSTTTTVGSYSAQIVFGTANTGELYQAIPSSTLVDYTFSCYVQRTSGTGSARLVAQDAGSPFAEFAAYTLPTGGGWQLATLTVKPSAGTSLRFSIKSGGTVASTWLVSECMFEEGKAIASTWTAAALDDTFSHDVYGAMAMRGGVTNLPTPTNSGDAATKGYVDGRILKGTATWDPASLANAATGTTTVTVTGAAVGDPVMGVGHTAVTAAGWTWRCRVSATNTVAVELTNNTGGTVDLASGTLTVLVSKI